MTRTRPRTAPGRPTRRRIACLLVALALGAACVAAPPPPAALAPGEHTAIADDGLRIVYHVAGHGPPCLVHPGGPGMAAGGG